MNLKMSSGEKISRKGFSDSEKSLRRILRDQTLDIFVKKMKIESDPYSDVRKRIEMCARFATSKVSTPATREKVTNVSEIPRRLNDDAHEWRNEVPTVPS